jgi:putative aldouronate transport system substrate-binding protein
MSPGRRTVVFLLLLVLLPARARASGAADSAGSSVTYPVRWFNESDAALVPVAKDPVSQAIQKRFNVKLTLLGGTAASGGAFARLMGDVKANVGLPADSYYRRGLPDVFPWYVGIEPPPSEVTELFAPLSFDLIRRVMPRTWTDIQVLATRRGMDPRQAWAPFESGGAVYAIPVPVGSSVYPTGVLWRADVLRELGKEVPATVEEWEAVFRAYRKAHPTGIAWTCTLSLDFFQPLLEATGQDLRGFVERDGAVESGLIQPGMRKVLQTLRRWYLERYIDFVPNRHRTVAVDPRELFASGASIVATGVEADGGDWVCDDPLMPGSLPAACTSADPDAELVMGPLPVFVGVTRPAQGTAGLPFGTQCFGFNAELARQPQKLERIMGMVEGLAHDPSMYLTAMFGVQGVHWEWTRSGDERLPGILSGARPAANTGRYWIYPWTDLAAQYIVPRRIRDSITERFEASGSLYAQRGRDAGALTVSIPYAEATSQALQDKAVYRRLSNIILSRFSTFVFQPVILGTTDIGAFDDFVAWYRNNGGDELAAVAARWSRR